MGVIIDMGKRVIRYGCFESNSSSCHTVSIRDKKNVKGFYSAPSNGILEIRLDEYGWSGYPCDDFIEKLKYTMSMVLHTEYHGFNYYDEEFTVDDKKLHELDGYKKILEAINKHFECDEIVIKKRNNSYYPYGYIDHQSYESFDSLQDFLDEWNVDIERFLFDYGVIVWISNDNE